MSSIIIENYSDEDLEELKKISSEKIKISEEIEKINETIYPLTQELEKVELQSTDIVEKMRRLKAELKDNINSELQKEYYDSLNEFTDVKKKRENLDNEIFVWGTKKIKLINQLEELKKSEYKLDEETQNKLNPKEETIEGTISIKPIKNSFKKIHISSKNAIIKTKFSAISVLRNTFEKAKKKSKINIAEELKTKIENSKLVTIISSKISAKKQAEEDQRLKQERQEKVKTIAEEVKNYKEKKDINSSEEMINYIGESKEEISEEELDERINLDRKNSNNSKFDVVTSKEYAEKNAKKIDDKSYEKISINQEPVKENEEEKNVLPDPEDNPQRQIYLDELKKSDEVVSKPEDMDAYLANKENIDLKNMNSNSELKLQDSFDGYKERNEQLKDNSRVRLSDSEIKNNLKDPSVLLNAALKSEASTNNNEKPKNNVNYNKVVVALKDKLANRILPIFEKEGMYQIVTQFDNQVVKAVSYKMYLEQQVQSNNEKINSESISEEEKNSLIAQNEKLKAEETKQYKELYSEKLNILNNAQVQSKEEYDKIQNYVSSTLENYEDAMVNPFETSPDEAVSKKIA